MRHVAISALILVSLTAGCGDSDDTKKEDAGTDTGGSSAGNGNGTTDGNGNGTTPQVEDDEDLDNACDYDPCCLGNDEYDYERCNPKMDAGMEDSSVAEADAAADAGADAGTDAGPGKSE